MVEAVNPPEHWSLSPRGLEVVTAGFRVDPRNRSRHLVNMVAPPMPARTVPRAKPAATSSTVAKMPSAKRDAADEWLSSLPAAAPEAKKPAVTGSLIWLWDGCQLSAKKAERSEHVVTLEGVTVLRAGHLFDRADARFPYLVLRENAVTAMGPMIEQDQG